MVKKLVVPRLSGIKVVAALAAIFVILTGPARADDQDDDPSHDAPRTHAQNVEYMLELMRVPAQVDQTADEILKLYSSRVAPDNSDPNANSIIETYQKEAMRNVYGVLGWESIKQNYINSYASRMGERDVATVTNFLKSPVGQKFLASQANAGVEIQQSTKQLMETDLLKRMTKLSSALSEALVKLRTTQSPK